MCRLKGLEDAVSFSVVHWRMRERGWTFTPGPCMTGDPVNGAETLSQIYVAADPHYTGRVTVPVLWDKEHRTIVNNESAEIIRMFNGAFDGIGAVPDAFHRQSRRAPRPGHRHQPSRPAERMGCGAAGQGDRSRPAGDLHDRSGRRSMALAGRARLDPSGETIRAGTTSTRNQS